MSRRRSPVKGRTRRGAALVALALVVPVGLLVGACCIAVQALQARDDLAAAATHLTGLRAAATAGDQTAARAQLAALQERADDAHAETHTVLWRAARHLPVVGDDVAAVMTVSGAVQALADRAAPPLVAALHRVDLERLAPSGGRVSIPALRRLGDSLGSVREVVAEQHRRVQGIAADELITPLRAPVTSVQAKLARLDAGVGAATSAFGVLPTMLGSDEPQHYLLLFQNNAEMRSRGGLVGAFAALSTDRGRLALDRQGTAGDFPVYDHPVLPMSQDQVAIHSTRPAEFFQNTTMLADFPQAARMAAEMYRREFGHQVDGVLSLDPVGLSYLLEGLGPVAVDGRTLTSDNAVDVLLNQTYQQVADPEAQNDFFAQVAGAVFERLAGGARDPRAAVAGLVRAGQEGRLLAWSRDPQVEAVFDSAVVGGALPPAAARASTVGVYLNDATGAKLEYYLHYDVTTEGVRCLPDGRRHLETSLTLTSTAPADAATSLADSVVGPGFGIAPRGSTYLKLDVYGPTGGEVSHVRFDGKQVGVRRLTLDGRPVAETFVLLRPQQTIRVTMDVVVAAHAQESVRYDVTPGVEPENESFVVPTGCE